MVGLALSLDTNVDVSDSCASVIICCFLEYVLAEDRNWEIEQGLELSTLLLEVGILSSILTTGPQNHTLELA